MDFSGRTVWITGASSGIGEALAEELAVRGAHLILSSRRPDALADVRSRLGQPDRHHIVPLDLGDPESLGEIVDQTLERVPSVDVLINNGGVSQRAFAVETDLAVDRRLMEINYLGTVAMTKAVLPGMLERGQGWIVCVSSVAGKVGSQMRSGYSASKHAVVGYMDCLRAEVFGQGVRVLVACPGWVRTNISFNAMNGRGEPENVMDPTIANGISAQDCARAIIRGLDKGRDEVIIGKGLSRMGPTIKRLAPGLVNRIIRSAVLR